MKERVTMRVCYFGAYDPGYSRNAILRRGLQRAGVDVVECRVPRRLAAGHASVSDTGTADISLQRLRKEVVELWRTAKRVAFLVREFGRVQGGADAVIVAEYNQALAALAYVLARPRGVPVVVDFLVSMYDEAVNHRRLLRPLRPRAIFRYFADLSSIRLAHRLLVDTEANREHFERQFGGVVRKSHVVPVGAPEWLFTPSPVPVRAGAPMTVMFFGNYNPLHGIDVILDAASRLSAEGGFHFRMYGMGQDLGRAQSAAAAAQLANVTFHEPLAGQALAAALRDADVVLGSFASIAANQRVVPYKVFVGLSSGRPVVTGDGPAPRGVLTHGHDALLVEPGSGEALAAALRRLDSDPALARRLATQGAELFQSRYASGPLGARVKDVVESIGRERPHAVP